MIAPRRTAIGIVLLCSFATVATFAEEQAALPVPAEEQRVLDALAADKPDDALAAMPAAMAAREAQASANPAAAADALDHLGAAIYEGAGGSEASIAAAEAAMQRALAIRKRAFGERAAETAKSYTTLSDLAFNRGRWDEAETLERRALEIRREALPTGDPAIAGSLDGLGIVLVRQGRLADAEPLLSESVRVYTMSMTAPKAKRFEAMNSLGELYRQQDRLEESQRLFVDAIAGAEALGPEASSLVGMLVNNLAGLLKDKGDLAEAESLIRRSLALREAEPDPDPGDLSVGYLNLAEIYRLEGNAAEAEPLYKKSIDFARRGLGDDHPDLATHYGQLAALYRETNRIGEARKLSDQSIALLTRTLGPDHPLLAQALHDRGVLETDDKHPADALKYLRKALSIREKAFGPTNVEVAATLTELARAEIAAGGEAARKAPADLDRALAILDATKAYPETAIDALELRAGLARQSGNLAAARDDLVAAAKTVESLRQSAGGGETTRALFLAKHASVFDQLIDLLLTGSHVSEAFDWSERARGRALLDQLASAGVDLRQGIPEPRRSELRAKETTARSALAEWQVRSDTLTWRDDLDPATRRARLDEARRKLAEASAEVRRVDEETKNASALWRTSSGGEPANLEQARGLLAPGERIYVYQLDTRGGWLLEIPAAPEPATASKLTVDAKTAAALGIAAGPLTLAKLERVLGGPAGLIAELARRPVPGFPDESSRSLRALFDALIPPAARVRLSSSTGLVVLPDGPLSGLPFEALMPKDGGYWIDGGPPIRYAVSATLLRELAERPASRAEGLLSVADPDYGPPGSSRWSKLPGTAVESDAVISAFKSRAPDVPVTVLRGTEATEPAVRGALPGKRYLHLAVHGLVDEGRGDLLAALALTRANDDGLLQLFEIYDLSLDCDVAVLSACSTQAGTSIGGEGVFALGRGFLARGARRVIASQWEVDDASTATLMAAFFESVARAPSGGMAAQLAAAKKKVRSDPKTSAPFYWAPFVLSGLR